MGWNCHNSKPKPSALARELLASRGEQPKDARAEVLRVWRVNPRNWSLGIAVVMPIPVLVLAIACVNAANLMLARGSHHQRELAIRLAIGAGRGRIVRQLLIESAILALLATAIALPSVWQGLHLAPNPWGIAFPIDTTVLMLTVMIAVATTVAFGLAPAIRLTAQQPANALGPASARSDAVPKQSRMRRGLLIAQVALSLALLATGSQLVSTVRSEAVSAGTPADRLLIARFDLEPLKLQPGDIEIFYRELLAGTARMPGVEAVGLARHTAVWTFGQGPTPASLMVWHSTDRPDDGQVMIGGVAGGDLFDAVGLRIVQGRRFTEADRHVRPQVAIVNEIAAKALNGPAVGSILRVATRTGDIQSSTEVRIVGVVEAAIEPGLERGKPPLPRIYLPTSLQPEPALALYVRTSGPAVAVAKPLRELVSQIGPRVPVPEIGPLSEFNDRSYAIQLWLARGTVLLGAIGIFLATAGLYGVSSYLVAMRSRELAIRMAVGAAPKTILTMVLRQSMRVAIIGLLVGAGAAIAVSRWIQSEYHGILGIDGEVFGITVALFILAMFLATAIPAARASRLDPVIWDQLHAAHGPREAARLFAKVLGQLDTHGAAVVVPALHAALATGTPLLLALTPARSAARVGRARRACRRRCATSTSAAAARPTTTAGSSRWRRMSATTRPRSRRRADAGAEAARRRAHVRSPRPSSARCALAARGLSPRGPARAEQSLAARVGDPPAAPRGALPGGEDARHVRLHRGRRRQRDAAKT